jgi:hypothetical protein
MNFIIVGKRLNQNFGFMVTKIMFILKIIHNSAVDFVVVCAVVALVYLVSKIGVVVAGFQQSLTDRVVVAAVVIVDQVIYKQFLLK